MGRICYNSKDAYKDVVIEFTEDTKLEYLIHYAAPYTGNGRTIVPKGTRLQLHQYMNDLCFYVNAIDSNLEKDLWKKENEIEGPLKDRCTGISLFVYISTFFRRSTIFLKGVMLFMAAVPNFMTISTQLREMCLVISFVLMPEH